MDGPTNIHEPCARCQRRVAVNTAYAEDAAVMALRTEDLEAERDTYRALSAKLMETCQQLVRQRSNLTALCIAQRIALDDRSRLDDNYSERYVAGKYVEAVATGRVTVPRGNQASPSRSLRQSAHPRGRTVYRRRSPSSSEPASLGGPAVNVVTLPSLEQADVFAKTKGGAIDAESLDNIRTALRLADVDLTYDPFRREPLVNDKPADDLTIDRLWVMLEDRFGFRPSKEILRTIVVTEADKVHVHPVRDYLDGLQWDGEARLDTWLTTYAGATDSPYVRAVGALPLIAAVRRVREPGTKFDEMLIVESPQGEFKSSALRGLCPDDAWFSDDLPLGVESKQVIERTTGKWIIEASELHGNRGREVEQLKGFLSRQVDGPVRLAYGRLPVSVPRQFVIIGTTNTTIGYLKDSTGGRRFWPVQVQRFDVDALKRDRDQLWAEAAYREDSAESIRLSPELWEAAAEQQEQRRACDPWEDVLEGVLDDHDAVSVDAIWQALGVEPSYRDNRHADRVTAILQRRGFTKRKYRAVTGGGNPSWHWIRSERSKERSE